MGTPLLAQSPLSQQVRITNPDGTPTQEFMQKWADQVRFNASSSPITTLAQLSAVLDLAGSGVGSLLQRTSISWGTLVPPGDATRFLNGATPGTFAQVKDSDLAFTDVTAGNVSTAAHGFAPKAPADATKFLNGANSPTYANVKETDLAFTDVTGNNVSTAKHGFVPKAPGVATQYLDGTGAWSTPSGGGGGGVSAINSTPHLATAFSTTTDSYAMRAMHFTPTRNFTVYGIFGFFSYTAGATFTAWLAALSNNGLSPTISSFTQLDVSNIASPQGAVAIPNTLAFKSGSGGGGGPGVSVSAGTTYAAIIARTDSLATTNPFLKFATFQYLQPIPGVWERCSNTALLAPTVGATLTGAGFLNQMIWLAWG